MTLGAAIVLAVLIVTYVVVPRIRLDRRLDALRAAGYPTSFTELAQYNRLPEGTPNAAPLYERAFAAFVPPVDDANVPFLGKAEWPDNGVPLSEPAANAVSECLAANQNCLELLHEAAGIEDCRYEWDYTDLQNGVPQWESLRHCVRLLRLRVAADVYAGDADSALQHFKDQLQLGKSLQREPGAINYLMRIACHGVAMEGLERILSTATLSDLELRHASEMISSLADTLDLSQVMITEQCFMIEFWRLLTGGERSSPGGAFLRLLSDRGMTETLDYASRSVEAAKLPSVQRLAGFQELDEIALEGPSLLHPLGGIFMTPLWRTVEVDTRARAHLGMAKTALAIERYRLATDKVPERLEELVPQYLTEVPIDPFDDNPIRYRRTDPGYLLYSVDWDGQDNGGKEKRGVSPGEPYDRAFAVTR